MISGTQGQDEVLAKRTSKLSAKKLLSGAILLVAVYFVAPVFSLWSSSIPNISQEDLIISMVIRGDLIRDVAVNGKVVAANAPQLYSSEEGQVTLIAKPGETVEKHQIVARLASPELKAQIKQQSSTLELLKVDAKRGELANKEAQLNLESEVNSALSELNVAKREKQRAEISYKKQVMSEIDWMKSQDRLEDAQRNYHHVKKRLSLAEERLKFENQNREFEVERQQLVLNELLRREQALNITAPVSGVVGNWLVDQKNKVAMNTPVMSIVDLSEYEAELSVPEFYADELGIGLTVSMRIGNHDVKGTIVAISPEIKANQVQVRAKLADSSALSLRQNQRLNARIEFEKKPDVLMVKKGAFLGSKGGKHAFLLESPELARQVPISIGSSSVEYVELLSGAKEGDRIVISDYEEFLQAEAIRIQ